MASRHVGGSLGIAVMGAIIAAEIGDRRSPEAFVDGFSTALLVAALIAFAGAAVAFATVRMHRPAAEAAPVAEAA
jgi:hypothetical protein